MYLNPSFVNAEYFLGFGVGFYSVILVQGSRMGEKTRAFFAGLVGYC